MVSRTTLTPNPSKTLLSFLTQLPYLIRRNLFLFHFKLQILILTFKAIHTHHFPKPTALRAPSVPSILLMFDSLGRGIKMVEGLLFGHILLSIHPQKWKQNLNFSDSLKIFQFCRRGLPTHKLPGQISVEKKAFYSG